MERTIFGEGSWAAGTQRVKLIQTVKVLERARLEPSIAKEFGQRYTDKR